MTMKTNVALAVAAASLFASAAFANTHHEAKVHCYGANSCKGTSECKTQHHACKGMNDCKGKGMTMMSAKECHEKGGTVHEKK